VQDIGAGQVQGSRPEQTDWKPSRSASESVPDDSEDAQFATNPGFSTPDRVFDIPLGYKLHLDGVSIFNVDNGVMEERVWSMQGRPVVQNPSNLKLWYSGRIKLLGDDDKPDLGKTQQIGYPGAPIPGLDPWLPVDPEMAKGLNVPLPVRQPSKKNKKK
jgi:hypothetical protein